MRILETFPPLEREWGRRWWLIELIRGWVPDGVAIPPGDHPFDTMVGALRRRDVDRGVRSEVVAVAIGEFLWVTGGSGRADDLVYRALLRFLATFPSRHRPGLMFRLFKCLMRARGDEERSDALLALASHLTLSVGMRIPYIRLEVAGHLDRPGTALAAWRVLQAMWHVAEDDGDRVVLRDEAIRAIPRVIRTLGPESEGVTTVLYWLFREFEPALARGDTAAIDRFREVIEGEGIDVGVLLERVEWRLSASDFFPRTWRYLTGSVSVPCPA